MFNVGWEYLFQILNIGLQCVSLHPKNEVEGFGLLATTKKMLNQHIQVYDSQTSIR